MSEMVNPSPSAFPLTASLLCELGALAAGVGAHTGGNVDRRSPSAEQKEQKPPSLCGQENNMKQSEGFGKLDLFCFWNISRGQAGSCVWIGKKGKTVQRKILFRFYSGCYWIQENTKRLKLCEGMKVVAPRPEGTLSPPGTGWDSIWEPWAYLSICHQPGQFSPTWSHLRCFPFLNINGLDNK